MNFFRFKKAISISAILAVAVLLKSCQVDLINPHKSTALSSTQEAASPGVPLSISGLKLWLKADAITGLNDGDAVGSWSDYSGNGNNATQATGANQPVYQATAMNGRPTVRFDGVNDVLNFPDAAFPSDPTTVFTVYKPLALANRSIVISTGGGSGTQASGVYYYTNTIWAPRGTYGASSGSKYVDADLFTLTPKLISAIYQGGSDNPSVHLNGTGLTRAAEDGYGLPDGCSGNLIGYLLNGHIAEILIYNQALADADRTRVEAYLNAKYGLY